jgi:hypothetical protein
MNTHKFNNDIFKELDRVYTAPLFDFLRWLINKLTFKQKSVYKSN